MARYRNLWQDATEKLQATQHAYSEELRCKEQEFSRVMDVLQQKFDTCQTGSTGSARFWFNAVA
jgi:hypothetical protein